MTEHGRKGERVDGALFTMWLSKAEREELTLRAGYRGISSAEYVRRALQAVAVVGGPEEFTERNEKRKTKGKNK
jgi:hypothetical protein